MEIIMKIQTKHNMIIYF